MNEILPIFNAVIQSEDEGMFVLSLVDAPAVESNFIAFSKNEKPLQFSIDNEEKRMVKGVVMRADYPIYRINGNGYEYYIQYSAETIKQMAQKFLKDGCQNNIDLMHNGELINGVEIVEMFLKDDANGISPKGFEDISNGSLFATYHISNDEVWKQVKDGVFNGFSLEGYFSIIPSEKEKKFNKQNNNKLQMKINKIKEMLRNMLQQFGEVATDKCVLVYDEDELAVGISVHSIDEEGNVIAVEDGEYKTDDKITIIVADGKITEIKDELEEAPIVEEVEESEAEVVEAEESEESEETEEKPNYEEKIAELEAEIEAKNAEIEDLKAKIAELEAEPNAESAEEQFAKCAEKEDKSEKAKMIKRGYKF